MHVTGGSTNQHRRGQIARLVVSLIVLVVAGISGAMLAPTKDLGMLALTILAVMALIDLLFFVLGLFGKRSNDRSRSKLFWP